MDRAILQQRQLTLRFPLRGQFRLDDFVAGDDVELLAQLGALGRDRRFQSLWLAAEPCSGKSHLLQGACHAVAAGGGLVAYLPARELRGDTEALSGLGGFALVAVDDADLLIGARRSEEALLSLYLDLATTGGVLLTAAGTTPAALVFALPDLGSRMRAAQCFRVRALGDEDKAEVARRYAARSGIELRDDALRFLMQRGSRDPARLLRQIDVLDAAALSAHRRVTVPFIKSVLGL
jgi:DnaA-homolog protein